MSDLIEKVEANARERDCRSRCFLRSENSWLQRTQVSVAQREREIAETRSLCNGAQGVENARKNPFLNQESLALWPSA